MCCPHKTCNSDAKGHSVGMKNQGGYLNLIGVCLKHCYEESREIFKFSWGLFVKLFSYLHMYCLLFL